VYFPTYAAEKHSGSAWQTQLRLMRRLPESERAA
jgi:hypothetical protein